MDKSLADLYKEAEQLAGRPVEVVGTMDKKYIVEWFCAEASPPPKADSEEEALLGFIDKLKARKLDPLITDADLPKGEDTDAEDLSVSRL